jgi:hypothetical protein
MKSLALCCFVAVLLVACGGGEPDAAIASTTPEISSEREKALAVNNWTLVANEYETFDVATTSTVRYGAGDSWVQRSVSGRAVCSNEFFGSDPAFMVVKRCEVESGGAPAPVPAPTPAPAPAPSVGGWTYVTDEGASFAVAGTRAVRYGTGNAWLQRDVSSGGACSNDFFGADPAFMVVKRCEVWSDGAAAPAPAPAPAPSPAPTPAPAPAPTPSPAPTPAPSPAPAPAGPSFGQPRNSAAIMVSGHSLTAHSIFANMDAVATSKGTPMAWNTQIVNGSPTRFRTRGGDLNDPTFSGYRNGENRNGTNMNIAAELLAPQTIGGQRYDTLLLTERHDIVNTLLWEDTVRYTRHFQDRLVAGNAAANGYLYHSWLAINNKADPSSWIGYERTAAKAWQCTAARVNVSLAAAGRRDRMTYLPAGLALADLVERAALHGSVAGVSTGNAAQTIDRLFTDNVHLSALGEYYMALVSYASVYRRSPVGAWVPSGVTAEQVSALQNLAWQSVSNHYNSASEPGMDQCQALMRDEVCNAYANYSGNTGVAGACIGRFTQQAQANPFYFDAAADSGYWFP